VPDLDLSLDDIRSSGVLSGLRSTPPAEESQASEPSANPDTEITPAQREAEAAPETPAQESSRRRSAAGAHAGRSRQTPPPAVPQGAGRSREVLERSTRQTSIALDPELLGSLDTYRRALGESQNAVFVAVLLVGLPTEDEDAVDAMLTEKYEHQTRRVEQNVRLPLPLLDRVDELVAPARAQDRSLSRAHLVNAALRAGMPETVDEARKLMANHLKARISASKAEF
jgi:hypothetical protein